MGEIIPFMILALVVLAIIGAFLMRMAFNRKVVVKPVDQEDLVDRIKIQLKDTEVTDLVGKLNAASNNAVASGIPVLVTHYLDGGTDRMVQFEVIGTKPRPKSKVV